MRTTVLFTVASLLLIGSYSLPQPEEIEASRAIENREAQGGHFPGHDSEGWRHGNHHGGGPGASNSTKITERQEHHGWPGEHGPGEHHDGSHHKQGGDRSNATKIKERQEYPPGHEYGPPDGMTWQEFIEYEKEQHGGHQKTGGPKKTGGSKTKNAHGALSTGTSNTEYLSGSTTNSTKVRLVKFKE